MSKPPILASEPLSQSPLLLPLLAFISGIVLFDALPSAWIFAGVLAGMLIFCLFRCFHASVLSGMVGVGALCLFAQQPIDMPRWMEGRPANYSGRVVDYTVNADNDRAIVEIDSMNGLRIPTIKAKLVFLHSSTSVDESHRIRFRAALRPLSTPRIFPGEPDYDRPYYRRGVKVGAMVTSRELLSCTPRQDFHAVCIRMRHTLSDSISRLPISSRSIGLLDALITGDRSGLNPDDTSNFSRAGLAHILALSGLHVSILILIITVLLLPVCMAFRKKRVYPLIICLLWTFAAVTGFSSSVVRSVIMTSIFMISVWIERRWYPLNALCASAFIILAVSPVELFSLGFQLSFIAVASIIMLADKLRIFESPVFIISRLGSYIRVSIAAMIGTGLVSAYHFHTFPVYFILSNIVASLVLPILLSCGVVMLLLQVLGYTPAWMGWTIDHCTDIVTDGAKWTTNLPGAVVDSIHFSGITLWLGILAILAFTWLLYSKSPRSLYCTLALFIATFASYTPASLPTQTEVYRYKVNRSKVLVAHRGSTLYILTDARPGARPTVYFRTKRRLQNLISQKRVRKIVYADYPALSLNEKIEAIDRHLLLK